MLSCIACCVAVLKAYVAPWVLAPAQDHAAPLDNFYRTHESPQFQALREVMRDPVTLKQLHGIARDPNATATARRLWQQASMDPQMLAMLRDQERRVRSDPGLMRIMQAMQQATRCPPPT
jgi:hypothetical protein